MYLSQNYKSVIARCANDFFDFLHKSNIRNQSRTSLEVFAMKIEKIVRCTRNGLAYGAVSIKSELSEGKLSIETDVIELVINTRTNFAYNCLFKLSHVLSSFCILRKKFDCQFLGPCNPAYMTIIYNIF